MLQLQRLIVFFAFLYLRTASEAQETKYATRSGLTNTARLDCIHDLESWVGKIRTELKIDFSKGHQYAKIFIKWIQTS